MKMEPKDDNDSDEEVFFGKLTLKEVMKHILLGMRQSEVSRLAARHHNIFAKLKNVESTSEPKIVFREDTGNSPSKEFKSSSSSDPHFDRHQKKPLQELESEDSLLTIDVNKPSANENCLTHTTLELSQLSLTNANNSGNILDEIDCILNSSPIYVREIELLTTDVNKPSTNNSCLTCNIDVPKDTILSQSASLELSLTNTNYSGNILDAIDFILNSSPIYVREKELLTTDVNKPSTNEICLTHNTDFCNDKILSQSASLESYKKSKDQLSKSISSEVKPLKIPPVNPVSANIKNTTLKKKIQFKTLKQPISYRKDTGCLKSPSRTKAFEQILSPIATYIRKENPQTPLVKRVCPKKPLPSVSYYYIHKLKKSGSEIKTSNKGNVSLPSLAYRCAKKTTVMNVNKDKWPRNNSPKKLASVPIPGFRQAKPWY